MTLPAALDGPRDLSLGGHRAARADSADPGLDAAVARARAGDETAFTELFQIVQPRLLRYLWARAGDAAQDVASETWLRVVSGLHRFDGDGDAFVRWVFTIARCRAVDAARARRVPTVPISDDDVTVSASADDVVIADHELRTMLAVIRQLSPDQADAVTLRYVAGLDVAATADVLGKSPTAVRVSCHRGLRRLAAMWPAGTTDDSAEVRR